MFSRDLYNPKTRELWGVRVMGNVITTHEGNRIKYFDKRSGRYASTDTWPGSPAIALQRAFKEMNDRQKRGFSETERSRSRRCFEFRNRRSSKFWIVELDRDTLHIQFGRIPAEHYLDDAHYLYHGYDSSGQSRAKKFPTLEKARDSYTKLIQAKLKEGYKECYPRELLPCVFGQLYHILPTLNPAWLRWNDGAIPRIAQAIYDERRFADLPILADALEEAGCTSGDILEHCRRPGPHVRGCWVVDLVLDRS